ncbi:hypothetical protein EG328_007470 [Venturia inaequalis]|uniref:PHD-type domain-containing protein n=1 Tax=Venturia inaequalis TaxID=5025 RepID=A0A8H3ZD66_VENIN|nr:hypothetical protein EG328_007470 [Venturia inaequalis]KAE9994764.1 hypothetical protein EG327_003028 [Venturia inaequalis]
MASLRGNRKSSRTSSPFAAASTDPKKQERKQTSLDTWMEPSPRTPVPSFEDHGFERGGVVGNMAALGSLPPASRQKLRINMTNRPTPVPDLLSDTPEAASETPDVASETMEVAPQTPLEIASRTPERTLPDVETAVPEVPEVKEEQVKREFTPVAFQFAPRAAQSPVFQNGMTTPSAHSRQQSQTSIATPPSAVSHAAMAQAFSHNRSPHPRGKIVDEAVINAVVEIAHRQGHPSMGLAVKRIYHQSLGDPELAILLDAALLRNPTPEQNIRWAEEIKRHKKDIKREGKNAKRLAKSVQRSDPLNTFTSFSQPPPTMGTIATIATIGTPMPSYSLNTTIGSSGSNTPPLLPPPSLQTFHPQPFLASSPHFESRSQTPNSNTLPHPFTNGAGTNISNSSNNSEIMVETRGQKRKGGAGSRPSTPAVAAQQTAPPSNAPATFASINASAPLTGPVSVTGANAAAAVPPTTSATIKPTPAGSGAISTQPAAPTMPVLPIAQPQSAPQPTTTASKTRRTRKTREATASATVTPDAQPQTLPPATSAAVAEPPKPEFVAEPPAAIKPDTPPLIITEPAVGHGTRARSLSSTSNLSDVDEELIEGGNPSLLNSRPNTSGQDAAVEPSLLDSPPPLSGRNTPRLGVGPAETGKGKGGKGKHKKTASKSAAGSKRSIMDAGLDEPSPETAKRQKQAQDLLDDSLAARKAMLDSHTVSDFRHSDEYASALSVPRPASPMKVFAGPDNTNYSSDTGSTHASSSRPARINAATTAPKGRGGRTRRNIDVTAAPNLEVPSAPSTPRSAQANGEPHAKRRKTARTKHSPVKQPATRAIGNARVTERDASPTADNGMDNSDVCFVCKKGGDLVCCDGCPNSVHPECWDPECSSSEDPEFQQNPWHCQDCRRRDAQDGESDGPDGWGQMLGAEDYSLPGEIHLTEEITDRTEGVERNTEFDKVGNYKSLKSVIISSVRNPAVPDVVDASKLIKDPTAMPYCYKCRLTSFSNPCPMIFCDDCKTPWHLDCLNPPMCSAPWITTKYVTNNRGQDKEVYHKQYWQCPLHISGSCTYLTDVVDDTSRSWLLRKFKDQKPTTPPNAGFDFYATGEVELDLAPVDARTGNAIYRMPEEAVINNFMLKCTRDKIRHKKDVAGLIELLPSAEQPKMEKVVRENFDARVEEVVQHRMRLFKQKEDAAIQKTKELSEDERNVALQLAAFPATVEKTNLEFLVQAANQVDATHDTVANLSLDQISVLEQLLADAKRSKLSAAERTQSVGSQATAAAER